MKIYIDLYGNIEKTEEVGLISGSWGNNFIDIYYQGEATYASISAIRNDSFHIKNLVIPKTQRMMDTENNLYFWRYQVQENDPLISVAGQLQLSVEFRKTKVIGDITRLESVVASVAYTTRVRKSVGSESEEEYNDFLQALEQYTEQLLSLNNNEEIEKIKQNINYLIENDKLSTKLIEIGQVSTIETDLLATLIKYGSKALIKFSEPPYLSLCMYMSEENNILFYKGIVVPTTNEIKTLTISINKETGQATYQFDNNVSDTTNSVPRRLNSFASATGDTSNQYLYVDNNGQDSKISVKQVASHVLRTVNTIPSDLQDGEYIFLKI